MSTMKMLADIASLLRAVDDIRARQEAQEKAIVTLEKAAITRTRPPLPRTGSVSVGVAKASKTAFQNKVDPNG